VDERWKGSTGAGWTARNSGAAYFGVGALWRVIDGVSVHGERQFKTQATWRNSWDLEIEIAGFSA
jgi:hypothetical protein